jgi:hypothetical protein
MARIARFKTARRSTSRMVGSGQLVVGRHRSAVGLAVTETTLFYERFIRKGSVDLESILAIEYDTVLATGVEVPDGRVLRLRTPPGTIEFILPREDVSNWYLILPPRPEKSAPGVVPWVTDTSLPPPLAWER